jgi:hypothetical protein
VAEPLGDSGQTKADRPHSILEFSRWHLIGR